MKTRDSKSWRYLTADAVGAAPGLAFDEAMMLNYGRDTSARMSACGTGALRLYTYREHCALVGRYQHLEEEVDLAQCAAHDIEIGRRPTGGGAIIMGPGQLGVAIAACASPEENPRETLRRYAAGLVAGLAGLGIIASFRSKNDLEVGGRKIAGLGVYFDSRGAVLFHSSLLVDLDIETMLKVLKIPGAKLSDKAVASVAERLTTVSRELGHRLQAQDVREQMADGIARAFGVKLSPDRFNADEARRYRELTERYASRSWIHRRSLRRDVQATSTLKTPQGLLRVHVGIHGGALKSVLLTGDFNVLPAGVARLESALKWCRAERSAITEAVHQCLHMTDLGAPPGEVAAAIWRAVSRGVRLNRRSHPVRPTGSCYFPEAEVTASPADGSAAKERRPHDAG
ncbi:MAG: lipoate--protein ligase family protein [bacterium]|nr:lipoate--protein ligase family protein [bacterium]